MKNPYLSFEKVHKEVLEMYYRYPEIKEDAELFEGMMHGETGLYELLDQYVAAIRENEMLAKSIAEGIGKLRERQTMLTRRCNFFRGLIHRLMDACEVQSISLPEAKISVVNTANKVIVTEESAIPDKYCKITKEPNKTAIKEALQSGFVVPGAYLSNGDTTIQVR